MCQCIEVAKYTHRFEYNYKDQGGLDPSCQGQRGGFNQIITNPLQGLQVSTARTAQVIALLVS